MLTGLISSWPEPQWSFHSGTEAPAWQHFVHILMGIDYWLTTNGGYTIPEFAKRVNTNLGEPSNEILTREELLEYHRDVEKKTDAYFSHLTDDTLLAPSPVYDQWTQLDVLIEVIRHMQHHIGQLNVLLRQQGHLPHMWDYHEPGS
jgi:uncharacterized damage-inducible protein DinB